MASTTLFNELGSASNTTASAEPIALKHDITRSNHSQKRDAPHLLPTPQSLIRLNDSVLTTNEESITAQTTTGTDREDTEMLGSNSSTNTSDTEPDAASPSSSDFPHFGQFAFDEMDSSLAEGTEPYDGSETRSFRGGQR